MLRSASIPSLTTKVKYSITISDKPCQHQRTHPRHQKCQATYPGRKVLGLQQHTRRVFVRARSGITRIYTGVATFETCTRTMFKRLRPFEIQLSYAIGQVPVVPLFPEPNKHCLHAQYERNFIGATATNTSGWIDLAISLPLSVESVKITDAIDHLCTTKPVSLTRVLEKGWKQRLLGFRSCAIYALWT